MDKRILHFCLQNNRLYTESVEKKTKIGCNDSINLESICALDRECQLTKFSYDVLLKAIVIRDTQILQTMRGEHRKFWIDYYPFTNETENVLTFMKFIAVMGY